MRDDVVKGVEIHVLSMVCRSLKQGHTSTAVNTDSAALTANTQSSSAGEHDGLVD